MTENIIVLGASDNPERYSNKAIKLLLEHEYNVIPIHPKLSEIEGLAVYAKLEAVEDKKIHTITVYVNPDISNSLYDAIVKTKVKRVIFNPGSENPELQNKLEKAGIEVLEACTLVLLATGQF